MEGLTLVQFLVALFMGLGGLCLFIWAVLSGQFTNVENIKYRAYRTEVHDDESARQPEA
jgi:cbb3-type cytochrome oxidase maturation protein